MIGQQEALENFKQDFDQLKGAVNMMRALLSLNKIAHIVEKSNLQNAKYATKSAQKGTTVPTANTTSAPCVAQCIASLDMK